MPGRVSCCRPVVVGGGTVAVASVSENATTLPPDRNVRSNVFYKAIDQRPRSILAGVICSNMIVPSSSAPLFTTSLCGSTGGRTGRGRASPSATVPAIDTMLCRWGELANVSGIGTESCPAECWRCFQLATKIWQSCLDYSLQGMSEARQAHRWRQKTGEGQRSLGVCLQLCLLLRNPGPYASTPRIDFVFRLAEEWGLEMSILLNLRSESFGHIAPRKHGPQSPQVAMGQAWSGNSECPELAIVCTPEGWPQSIHKEPRKTSTRRRNAAPNTKSNLPKKFSVSAPTSGLQRLAPTPSTSSPPCQI